MSSDLVPVVHEDKIFYVNKPVADLLDELRDHKSSATATIATLDSQNKSLLNMLERIVPKRHVPGPIKR